MEFLDGESSGVGNAGVKHRKVIWAWMKPSAHQPVKFALSPSLSKAHGKKVPSDDPSGCLVRVPPIMPKKYHLKSGTHVQLLSKSRLKNQSLRSCLKLYSQIIAYTAALPIQELHQVRNYTACTFDPPPAFLARFPSGLSPKNSGALHWWTTGIKHAGLRWVQVLMFHPRTLCAQLGRI
ncbi:hypothetical protein B0H13DRAFT_1912603 [Mycena leptocephala]|nr:hypothetical protein B0H13DRAFT_1912603 [Mycena leptocephala]